MADYYATHKQNPIAKPVYLSLVARATLSRHTGTPIIERYNPVYHYWATYRELKEHEVTKYIPGYEKNMKKYRH